jgi:hypothetical protein
MNRHDDAIAELKTCALLAPAFRPCHELAAVAYAEMGRLDEARAAAMEAHRVDPDFTLASAADVLPFKNPQDLQRFPRWSAQSRASQEITYLNGTPEKAQAVNAALASSLIGPRRCRPRPLPSVARWRIGASSGTASRVSTAKPIRDRSRWRLTMY